MKMLFRLSLFFNAFLIMSAVLLAKVITSVFVVVAYQNAISYLGISVLSLFCVLGFIGFFFLRIKNKGDYQTYQIKKINNVTGDYYLGYFSLFVLLFVEFDFATWFNFGAFIFCVLILCIVYCRNELYYINPVANIFGLRIYRIEAEREPEKATIVQFNDLVISKTKLNTSNEYKIYTNDKGYCYIEIKNNESEH